MSAPEDDPTVTSSVEVDELRARIEQLENAGRAMYEAIRPMPWSTLPEVLEFRAVLYGNASRR